MYGTNSGCGVRDLETRRYPIEIWIGGKQSVELIDSLFTRIPIRLNQYFGQGDRRRHCDVVRSLEPPENVVGEDHISRIGFQLIDEDACVQRDLSMFSQEGAEASQSQLWRSFSR
jgi:hypothetical protein